MGKKMGFCEVLKKLFVSLQSDKLPRKYDAENNLAI